MYTSRALVFLLLLAKPILAEAGAVFLWPSIYEDPKIPIFYKPKIIDSTQIFWPKWLNHKAEIKISDNARLKTGMFPPMINLKFEI